MPAAVAGRELPDLDVVRQKMRAVFKSARLGLQRQKIGVMAKRLTAPLDVVNPVYLASANLEQPNALKMPNS